jgi:hypothetical protein
MGEMYLPIEINYDGLHVRRGTIDRVIWWPNRHPRMLALKTDSVQIWRPNSNAWVPDADHRNFNVNFYRENFESFKGPYMTDPGEMFFLFAEKGYVVTYPIGHDLALPPFDFDACCRAHNEEMGYPVTM